MPLPPHETDGHSGSIHLTFDDGPDPDWTPRVLEALSRAGAGATFFVVAPLAQRYPDLIRETQHAGHAVELHCTRHVRHTSLTRAELEDDVRSGLRDLEALGARPQLWRPPWGVLAPWTEEIAENLGLTLTLWTHDTHDWRGDSAFSMLDRIGPSLEPGSVVLMHDGLGPGARRDGCGETVELIGPLTERIRELGCEPTPVGQRQSSVEAVS